MDPFLRQLLDIPAIDADTERGLATRARGGDEVAREALIVSSLRSVVLHGLVHGLRDDELRDAVQSGALALIRAVDRYDPDRGARLTTYAWRWIAAATAAPRRTEVPVDVLELPDVEAETPGCDLLAELPDELGELLALRFGVDSEGGETMSRPQVARRLGLTVAQVRTREQKAMRQLRERLAKVIHRASPQGAADPP